MQPWERHHGAASARPEGCSSRGTAGACAGPRGQGCRNPVLLPQRRAIYTASPGNPAEMAKPGRPIRHSSGVTEENGIESHCDSRFEVRSADIGLYLAHTV